MSVRAATVIVGIGHPDRGDDAVGRIVAERLVPQAGDGLDVLSMDGEATSVLAAIADRETAFLVDAAISGERPGLVRRIDAKIESLNFAHFGLSTHGFGLAEAIGLGTALGQLPARCIIYAIEAQSVEPGHGLSPEVAAAAETVISSIIEDLRDARRKPCMSTG